MSAEHARDDLLITRSFDAPAAVKDAAKETAKDAKGMKAALTSGDRVCAFHPPNFSNWQKDVRAAGGRVRWYRDGVLAASQDAPFRLQNLEDVNNWLGRSHWSGDRNTHAAYNEVRVYDHAMTPAEITASFSSGANPSFPLSDIAHRWSFGNTVGNANTGTTVPDLVGNANATIRGNGATFSGAAIDLSRTVFKSDMPASALSKVRRGLSKSYKGWRIKP